MNPTTRRTLMSSTRQDWRTPPAFFARLDAEFSFALDAAADASNHLCENFYTAADDALRQPWDAATFCNPPYGRAQAAFLRKALAEVAAGRCPVAVLLIPARTDTRAWHDAVMGATAVRLVRGRLRFLDAAGRPTAAAPFPSAVVVFARGGLGGPVFSSLAAER